MKGISYVGSVVSSKWKIPPEIIVEGRKTESTSHMEHTFRVLDISHFTNRNWGAVGTYLRWWRVFGADVSAEFGITHVGCCTKHKNNFKCNPSCGTLWKL